MKIFVVVLASLTAVCASGGGYLPARFDSLPSGGFASTVSNPYNVGGSVSRHANIGHGSFTAVPVHVKPKISYGGTAGGYGGSINGGNGGGHGGAWAASPNAYGYGGSKGFNSGGIKATVPVHVKPKISYGGTAGGYGGSINGGYGGGHKGNYGGAWAASPNAYGYGGSKGFNSGGIKAWSTKSAGYPGAFTSYGGSNGAAGWSGKSYRGTSSYGVNVGHNQGSFAPSSASSGWWKQ